MKIEKKELPVLIRRARIAPVLSFRVNLPVPYEGTATFDDNGRIIVTVGCQTHSIEWWRSKEGEERAAAEFADFYDMDAVYRFDFETDAEYATRRKRREVHNKRMADNLLLVGLHFQQTLDWIEAQLSA